MVKGIYGSECNNYCNWGCPDCLMDRIVASLVAGRADFLGMHCHFFLSPLQLERRGAERFAQGRKGWRAKF